MSESFGGRERRRFERALCKTDFFYSSGDGGEASLDFKGGRDSALVVDLGEGGVGIVSGKELAEGDSFEFAFVLKLSDAQEINVRARGVVRYCFMQADFRTYRAGLEFTEIDPAVKEAIAQYVRDQKKA